MKKREKFLIAFIISWCVVMSVFSANRIHIARYYSQHGKELEEWLFIDGDDIRYDNLTDEAKEYLEGKTLEKEENEKIAEMEKKQYCDENPDICSETMEQKILGAAGDYYIRISEEYSMANTNYETVELLLDISMQIVLLTLTIYFSITIEFKGMKKYCIDNLKVLLVTFGVIALSPICNIVLHYIAGINYEMIIDIFSLLSWVVLTIPVYGIFLLTNIIIILFREKKKRKIK